MFQLRFDIPESSIKIRLQDPLFLIGSCFTENIGQYFTNYKFNAHINPFGTIYNPLSIFRALDRSLQKKPEYRVFKNGDIYYDWYCHSAISSPEKDILFDLLKKVDDSVKSRLKEAKWVVISPGTAWVYELKDTGELVANCHKVPQKKFNRRLIRKEEIINEFISLKEKVESFNREVNWLFTISPVRHIRDGLIDNNRSKSTLHLAVHHLVENFENCFYFPSYEIVIDELRDYRFYEKDLIHPNNLATEYIWQRFYQSFMDRSAHQHIREWTSILQSLRHRPFHPSSPSHQKFIKETILKLEQLSNRVDTSKEISQLRSQLL